MKIKQHSLVYLENENDLNKILKAQRKIGEEISILYVSLWDNVCQKLVNKLERRYGKTSYEGPSTPLYIVNSLTMPHAFVIFKTSIVPHLITIGRNSLTVEDYLPHVYHRLSIS